MCIVDLCSNIPDSTGLDDKEEADSVSKQFLEEVSRHKEANGKVVSMYTLPLNHIPKVEGVKELWVWGTYPVADLEGFRLKLPFIEI